MFDIVPTYSKLTKEIYVKIDFFLANEKVFKFPFVFLKTVHTKPNYLIIIFQLI